MLRCLFGLISIVLGAIHCLGMPDLLWVCLAPVLMTDSGQQSVACDIFNVIECKKCVTRLTGVGCIKRNITNVCINTATLSAFGYIGYVQLCVRMLLIWRGGTCFSSLSM